MNKSGTLLYHLPKTKNKLFWRN